MKFNNSKSGNTIKKGNLIEHLICPLLNNIYIHVVWIYLVLLLFQSMIPPCFKTSNKRTFIWYWFWHFWKVSWEKWKFGKWILIMFFSYIILNWVLPSIIFKFQNIHKNNIYRTVIYLIYVYWYHLYV